MLIRRAMGCVATAFVLASCSPDLGPESPTASDPERLALEEYKHVAAAALRQSAQLCEKSAIRCGVAGPRSVTYALVPGRGKSFAPNSRLLLLEPGGPGLDLGQAFDASALLLDTIPNDRLLVSEPWTVTPPPVECLKELESIVPGTGERDYLSAWPDTCPTDSWWHDGEYLATISEIEKQLGRKVGGVVASSFGATSAIEVLADRRDLPAVVLSPAALPGTPLTTVLSSRAKAVPDWSAQRADGPAAVMAVLGAAYSPNERTDLISKLRGVDAADETVRQEVQRRAMAATYRFGSGEALPHLVGFLGGTCATYPANGSEHSAADRSHQSAFEILRRIHVCPVSESRPTVEREMPLGHSVPICIVLDTADLVTPQAVTGPWQHAVEEAQVTRFRSGYHGQVPPRWRKMLRDGVAGRGCGQDVRKVVG